jgi:hypothetical protein
MWMMDNPLSIRRLQDGRTWQADEVRRDARRTDARTRGRRPRRVVTLAAEQGASRSASARIQSLELTLRCTRIW